MAITDWTKPTLISLYTDFVDEVKNRDLDLAYGLDPVYVTNTPTFAIAGLKRWNTTNNYWEKHNGTAWVALSSAYTINITGNAATATTATNATAATNAANIGITNENATTATVYPVWSTATSGNVIAKVSSSKLSFIPSSGTLVATTFSGALSGTATSAGTLTSTLGVSLGGTGVNTLTGLFYGNGTAAVSAASAAQIVSVIGTTPVAQSTNIAGGAANRIAYQSGTATTTFAPAPTITGTVLGWGGTVFEWISPQSTVADGCIYENNRTILADYTLSTNKSGMSAGPITIAIGVSVTIPIGSRWVIL